jgi:hypothetical protein
LPDSPLVGFAERVGTCGRQVRLAWRTLPDGIKAINLAGALLFLANLASPELLRRAFGVVIGAAIMGGVFSIPVAAITALVGFLQPAHAPLHVVGGRLLGIAIVWFLLALLGAHLQASHGHHEPEEAGEPER